MDQITWPNILIVFCIIIGVFMYRSTRTKTKITLTKSHLEKFGQDITQLAREKGVDPVQGRDHEIERTIQILLRRQKNNPLLLGEPGVGKTAVIHGLAQRILEGNVPESLKQKRILALDVNTLVADTKLRGELEKRLRDLLKTLEHEEANVILFIDEIHMLAQIGESEGSLNISDVLKPALARGELQIIGATTWEEYKKFIKPDAALDRRFQPVLIEEPTPKQTIAILMSLRPIYEKFHHVTIPDETIKAAVALSNKKIAERYLPDKAIDLIDEASAKAAIEASHPTHAKALGVVYAASKNYKKMKGKNAPTTATKSIVTVKDIEDIVEQWAVHTQNEKKHTARQNKKYSS